MKMIRVLNRYFFDEDSITASDTFWYYGVLAIIITAFLIGVIF